MRPARMPRVDELPVPAQNQIRASRGERFRRTSRSLTLLQRLATVGFGRREEARRSPGAAACPGRSSCRGAAPRRVQPPRRPGQPSPVHAEYAKRRRPQGYRPAQGQLDPQGRAPTPRTIEEDQLEIPAFLRPPQAHGKARVAPAREYPWAAKGLPGACTRRRGFRMS